MHVHVCVQEMERKEEKMDEERGRDNLETMSLSTALSIPLSISFECLWNHFAAAAAAPFKTGERRKAKEIANDLLHILIPGSDPDDDDAASLFLSQALLFPLNLWMKRAKEREDSLSLSHS